MLAQLVKEPGAARKASSRRSYSKQGRITSRPRTSRLTAAPVKPGNPQSSAGKIGISIALALVAALAVITWAQYEDVIDRLRELPLGRMFVFLAMGLMFVTAAELVWRVVLVARYRPQPGCIDSQLPRCTVIVPAYNEGKFVYETLRSIAASDYPLGKLFVIAIDDGSKDDTWQWIRLAASEYPAMIRPMKMQKNSGKKFALYEAFQHAIGDIIVTIDSDSIVESQTVRNLVSPIVRDSRVGAVAGNVRVLNQNEGVIPRMMDISFAYSFDFIRASQSETNTVFCTPGALAAYRRDVVMECLPEWLTQRFMGRLSTIGEDRAITNLIVKRGYHSLFQRNAMVYTKVPTGYKGLCRMLLRWGRSNIRENWDMSKFLFGRFRSTPATGARVNLALEWLNMTIGEIIKLVVIFYFVFQPDLFGLRMLIATAIGASIPALFYAIRHRSTNALWSYAYSIFWLVGLWWIGIYSTITLHKNGWLTRDLPAHLPIDQEPIRPKVTPEAA